MVLQLPSLITTVGAVDVDYWVAEVVTISFHPWGCKGQFVVHGRAPHRTLHCAGHMIKKKHVLSALCALKVCAFKACLFVRLLTRFIAIDVELEIIDGQKICNGLVYNLFYFSLFY